jgi:hypothetical protein
MADKEKEHPMKDMASPVNAIGLIVFMAVCGGIVFVLGSPESRSFCKAWADDDVVLGTIGIWLMTHLSVAGLLPPLPAKWNVGEYPYYLPAGVVVGFLLGLLAKKIASFILIKPKESVFDDPLGDLRHYGMSTPPMPHLEYILPVCPNFDQERLLSDFYLCQTSRVPPPVPVSDIDQ